MKEIEILIEVKGTLQDALKALDQFESQGIKRTLDIYFQDPLRVDLKPDEKGELLNAFRLRQKGDKNYLTYKVDHFENGKWSHSDEYETEVKDFDVAMQIVERLGLTELVRIDNEKHTFVTEEYEIVLEDVKDLGLFMEVEKLKEVPDAEVAKAKEEIREFFAGLGIQLGEEQTAGKPELMLRKKS